MPSTKTDRMQGAGYHKHEELVTSAFEEHYNNKPLNDRKNLRERLTSCSVSTFSRAIWKEVMQYLSNRTEKTNKIPVLFL